VDYSLSRGGNWYSLPFNLGLGPSQFYFHGGRQPPSLRKAFLREFLRAWEKGPLGLKLSQGGP